MWVIVRSANGPGVGKVDPVAKDASTVARDQFGKVEWKCPAHAESHLDRFVAASGRRSTRSAVH